MQDFGKRIKELRQKAGLTQQQLAERIWVSKAAISNYELYERNPSPEILIKLARVFHVSTEYLLGIEEKTQVLDVSDLTDEDIRCWKVLPHCSARRIWSKAVSEPEKRNGKWNRDVMGCCDERQPIICYLVISCMHALASRSFVYTGCEPLRNTQQLPTGMYSTCLSDLSQRTLTACAVSTSFPPRYT